MSQVLRYRGRSVTESDVLAIRMLIASNPGESRWSLSRKLCRRWHWVQPNGQLCDALCRGLMLQLHRGGYIELPPVDPRMARIRAARGRVPKPVELNRTAVEGPLSSIGAVSFSQVRRTGQEPLFNSVIHQHHYLGYTQPVGAHLKYLVYAESRLLGALSWCSAARGLTCRDQYIGWSRSARSSNLRFLAYNARFLILPWVRVPHLASHVLGRMVKRLRLDWKRIYGHELYFLETFVDPQRYAGTCYRAANWRLLGWTTGRGHRCPTRQPNRPVKKVLGYPLSKRFRQLLSSPIVQASD